MRAPICSLWRTFRVRIQSRHACSSPCFGSFCGWWERACPHNSFLAALSLHPPKYMRKLLAGVLLSFSLSSASVPICVLILLLVPRIQHNCSPALSLTGCKPSPFLCVPHEARNDAGLYLDALLYRACGQYARRATRASAELHLCRRRRAFDALSP